MPLIADKTDQESDIFLGAWIRWKLWNVRKHMVLDDVHPEFDRFELETTGAKRMDEYREKEMDKSTE